MGNYIKEALAQGRGGKISQRKQHGSSVLRGVGGFAHQYDEPSCDDKLVIQDEFRK